MTDLAPSPAVQKYIEAAQALADKGENVTLAAVRREAGGGSMNTITEAVRLWREDQAEDQAPAAVMIPEAVQDASARALAAIWKEAQAQHRAALEAEREALNADRHRIEGERAEALELGRVVEQEALELRIKFEQAEDQIGNFTGALSKARNATAAAEARAEERADRIEAQADELEQAKAAALNSAAREERLSTELEQAQADADKATASARQAEDHAADLERGIEDLRADLADAGKELVQVKAKASSAARLITSAEARADAAEVRERTASTDAAKLAGKLEALEAMKPKPTRQRKTTKPAPKQ